MKHILLVMILALAVSPFASAQSRERQRSTNSGTAQYEAKVSDKEAVFIFPIIPRRQWEWFSGGLQYTWHVKVKNNNQEYDFGYYLFMPMGATPPEKGNFRQLLDAGQFSVWKNNEVVQGLSVEGFASSNGDKLTIKLSDARSIRLLFSSKPQYCIFESQLLSRKSSARVPIAYEPGRAESVTPRGPNDSFSDGDWDSFWTAFRTAVQRRDRSTLISMMSSSFQFASEEMTPAQAFTFLDADRGKAWVALNGVVAKGAVPYKSPSSSRPSRIAPPIAAKNPNYGSWRAIFDLGKDGRWRWVAFLIGD